MSNMENDSISRQAAIDEWKNDFKGYVNMLNIPRDDYNGIMEYIDELPSAQTETHDKHTEIHARDCISRQAAIDAIESTDWYHIEGGELVHGANSKEDEPLYKAKDIYSVIENLPSAQSEIIRCKDCKFSHMTINGECKYCDIWFQDEKCYMSGDYHCGSAERREE